METVLRRRLTSLQRPPRLSPRIAQTTRRLRRNTERSAQFAQATLNVLEDAYADVIRCLKCASAQEPIVEAESLRDLVLSIAAPALAWVAAGVTNDLNNIARSILGNTATLLDLKNSGGRLEIQLSTKILDVSAFPMVLTPDDNLIKRVSAALGL